MNSVGGLGGAPEDGIVAAYRGLGVTEDQYFDVSDFFVDVLRGMKVEAELVAAIGVTLANVHDQAVT